MQKSPKIAMLEVMAKATHHQRGAGCSTTPEIRSVNQLKLRRCSTSGTRVSRCSASLIVSGAVGAPSMLMEDRPAAGAQTKCLCSYSSFRQFLFKTCDPDVFRVGHLRVWIANAREITDSWDDIQIVKDPIIPVLLFHF